MVVMVYNMKIIYYINLNIKIGLIDEYDYCNLYYVETSGSNTSYSVGFFCNDVVYQLY